ncbi:MAG: phosphate acyltransferase [Ilumatobacteraceae bacterium]
MKPIAVDAMGGDKAPAEIVAGARQAAAEGIPVLLVGPADLADRGELELLVATEVIGMDEDPAGSVKKKKDSTLVRSAEAVRDGVASAMISAGNTGATMASALLRMGRIDGVKRPAIATPIPVPGSTPTILLDAGANAEVEAAWLTQFATMGSVFSKERYGIASPRVGLLSIGEEPGKGDTLRKQAYGCTGNVALKSLEGALKTVVKALFTAVGQPQYKEHADALMPAFLDLYSQFDPDTTGGAMLLGLNGVCIISHGSSSARAMVNGIKVARDMVQGDIVEKIRTAVAVSATS